MTRPRCKPGIDGIRARQIYLDVLWIEPGDYAEDVVIPAGARTYYITCRGGPAKTRIRSLTIRSVTGGRSIEITEPHGGGLHGRRAGSTQSEFTECRFAGAVSWRSYAETPSGSQFERCTFEAPLALHADCSVGECFFLGGRADFQSRKRMGVTSSEASLLGRTPQRPSKEPAASMDVRFVNVGVGIGGIASWKQSVTQCLFVGLRGPALDLPIDPRYLTPRLRLSATTTCGWATVIRTKATSMSRTTSPSTLSSATSSPATSTLPRRRPVLRPVPTVRSVPWASAAT